MNPRELAASIARILDDLARAQGRDLSIGADDVSVERPRSRDHGDWATNAAMQFGKRFESNPRALAETIAAALSAEPGIAAVDIAGPGFLNITLDSAAAGALAAEIVAAGTVYGRGDALAGIRMNLEFVSANPTGPIHIGGTRWAAVGDSLARVLQNQGAEVAREYYFNDHGEQIDRFARSLLAAHLGRPAPEDGYGGQYIHDIAAQVVAAAGAELDGLDESELQEQFRERGVAIMFAEIRESLHAFGVDFDVYFHENDLHNSGAVERAVARLRELGHIYESDGATWLRTTEFGDDKDRVIIKSDGQPAYISGDLAYYLDKRERGFDRCIIMLGADHHGYVQRLMAMCAAFGDTPRVNLDVMIGQLVNLKSDGVAVRMSKRAGTVVTLEDLVEAVGVDAARYALVRSSVDTPVDIDLDVLTKASNENPVYYVQYAHARTRSVARNAAAAGVDAASFDPALLDQSADAALLALLADWPRVAAQAAELREPHRVARYAEELAGSYHRWYDACRVTPLAGQSVEPVHGTRLVLNDAVAQVLQNALTMVGVSAPDRM